MSLYHKLRASNGFKSRALFFDVCRRFSMEDVDCLYWLDFKPEGRKEPSFREHFMLSEDPTGYETAMKYLGSYEHWEVLKRTVWFKEALQIWENDLHAKLKAKAIKVIQNIAFDPEDKQSLAAAKYIATAEYNKIDNRGRPSKEMITGKLKEAVAVAEADREDMERIGLRLVKS